MLPLYFARPIKTSDYPLAKYVAFTAACAVMIEVPLLVLYLGTIVNVHGGAAVWAQTREFIPAARRADVGGGAGRDQPVPREPDRRRAFATGTVAIFFLATYTLAEILLQWRTTASAAASPVDPERGPLVAPTVPMAEKAPGLFSPFTLFGGCGCG